MQASRSIRTRLAHPSTTIREQFTSPITILSLTMALGISTLLIISTIQSGSPGANEPENFRINPKEPHGGFQWDGQYFTVLREGNVIDRYSPRPTENLERRLERFRLAARKSIGIMTPFKVQNQPSLKVAATLSMSMTTRKRLPNTDDLRRFECLWHCVFRRAIRCWPQGKPVSLSPVSFKMLGALATGVVLTGCGGSQPPIGAPGAMPQGRAMAQRFQHPTLSLAREPAPMAPSPSGD